MIASRNSEYSVLDQTESNYLVLIKQIALRLNRRYKWINIEELYSYACLGLFMARTAYQPDRGVTFGNYAAHKALFLAVDQMRKDKILFRRDSKVRRAVRLVMEDIPDPNGAKARRRMEARDICSVLLSQLPNRDRQLLIMYYSDQMTFLQIAKVFSITESAVCLRHKAIIAKLRKVAASKCIC